MEEGDEDLSFFEHSFNHEILLSEQRRVLIQAVFFSALFFGNTVWVLAAPEYIETLFRGNYRYGLFATFFGLAALYEFSVYYVFGIFRKRGIFPKIQRFANSFVEISIPTIGIIMVATTMHPVYALTAPPLLAYGIFILLSTLRLEPRLSVFTGLVAFVQYTIISLIYLQEPLPGVYDPFFLSIPNHLGKGLLLALMGISAAFVARQIKERIVASMHSMDERNRVVSLFGQHVSPSVVEKLLDGKARLDSEMRQISVLFLDIRGFTTFSEKKQPQEVFDFLNKLFDFMIDIINKHGGIINKFLGDGFMAVFGAPIDSDEHKQQSVRAAMEITEMLIWHIDSGEIPETRVGIGIHAGEAVTGNIGSSQRKEYTIIGDVVNLASRIEQLNKDFGTQILISQEVYEGVKHEQPQAESKGMVHVKGREHSVEVYKLF